GGAGHELHVDHYGQKEGAALVGGNRLQFGLQFLGGQHQVRFGDLHLAHAGQNGGRIDRGGRFGRRGFWGRLLGGRRLFGGGLGQNRSRGERDGKGRWQQRSAQQAGHRSGEIE